MTDEIQVKNVDRIKVSHNRQFSRVELIDVNGTVTQFVVSAAHDFSIIMNGAAGKD